MIKITRMKRHGRKMSSSELEAFAKSIARSLYGDGVSATVIVRNKKYNTEDVPYDFKRPKYLEEK